MVTVPLLRGSGVPEFDRPLRHIYLIEHVRADLRRIVVPCLLPMTVDLPLRTSQPVIVFCAPFLNRSVRSAKTTIGPKMRGGCRRTAWGGGTDDLTSLRKGPLQFDAGLEADAPVPVDRHVASGLHVLGAHGLPGETAAFGHSTCKLERFDEAPHDSDGNGGHREKYN